MNKKEIIKKNSKLKNKGINYIKEYFPNKNDKSLISNKFSNISGKTGKYFVPETLFQKRTPRKNRVLIPFNHICEREITYNQLNSFEGGVAVEFVNNDFFTQMELPEEQQNPVFKKLKDKLGSDDNVSAIIVIRSTGESSSQVQREALIKLNEYLASLNKNIEEVLIRRKTNISYKGQGNDMWKGFVYYTVKGGQQDAIDSHEEYGILSTDVQLFNPSVEYASELVSNDITLVLTYFALHSIRKEQRDDAWEQIVEDYENYFSSRIYENKSLKEYVNNHVSLNLKPGILMDPIQVEPIYIEDFVISNRDENSLDITHQKSVNRHSYIWDASLEELLTPARPTNLFWSKHLSNMMQQDFSLKEYIINQCEIMKKWTAYGIDKIE